MKKMKSKIGFLVFAFVVVFTLILTTVSASTTSEPDIKEMTVYINGEAVWYSNSNISATPALPALERGSKAEIKVSFIANKDLNEVRVHTWLTGYREDIEAKTSSFDVFAGNLYTKTLTLEIPDDIDAKDTYTLYVKIEGRKELTGAAEAKIDIQIQRVANLIEILAVEVYGGDYSKEFSAGSTIYINTVVKNLGNYEAKDVFVRASINELGIMRTVYLGDLEANDNDDEDTKEATIALTLPADSIGTYTIEVYAYNSKASDKVIKNIVIKGIKGPIQKERKVEVTAKISTNDIEQGKGAVYNLIIINLGTTAENFVIETTGTEGWATTTITPESFSLAPGETKTVNIYVAASEQAVEGTHVFSAKIRYGDEIKEISLTANVKKSKAEVDWKIVLMIVGIVLAIVIIVLLILLLTTKQTKTETVESYY